MAHKLPDKIESASVSFAVRHAQKLAVFALLLPLVFFTWQVTKHVSEEKEYQEWRIPVEGYDPRDILKGRYIRYQYAFPWAESATTECVSDFGKQCCLCLNGEGVRPEASLVNCKSAVRYNQCDGLLRAESKNTRRQSNAFYMGLTEYYMDERAAKVLDKILRSGEILMSVDVLLRPRGENGKIAVTDKARLGELYINGRALSEMLEDESLPLDR